MLNFPNNQKLTETGILVVQILTQKGGKEGQLVNKTILKKALMEMLRINCQDCPISLYAVYIAQKDFEEARSGIQALSQGDCTIARI